MKKFSNIEFYFPTVKSTSKEKIAKDIVGMIKENQSLLYCGFADEQTAIDDIKKNLGDGTTSSYAPISDKERDKIEKIVEDVLKKK